MYKFEEQLKLGQDCEKEIYNYLRATGWKIKVADRDNQRKGIDCFVSSKDKHYAIEIKSDKKASKTGNAFFETISVDNKNIKGWAYTSQADYIFYYLPNDELIYIISPLWVKKNIKRLETVYPKRIIPNKGYNTVGVLVPLYILEQYAKVISF